MNLAVRDAQVLLHFAPASSALTRNRDLHPSNSYQRISCNSNILNIFKYSSFPLSERGSFYRIAWPGTAESLDSAEPSLNYTSTRKVGGNSTVGFAFTFASVPPLISIISSICVRRTGMPVSSHITFSQAPSPVLRAPIVHPTL